MRILIVDDDNLRSDKLISHIEKNKENCAFEFYTASSVQDAKALLKSLHFDVMILDVVLPMRNLSKPDSEQGLSLLGQVSRGRNLIKPTKIIGITAHIEDIKNYKIEFENSCHLLIEASNDNEVWKQKIVNFLSYQNEAESQRTLANSPVTVITIHGIRTFGSWQKNLEDLIKSRTDFISVESYKYGYFSILSYIFPNLRKKESAKLQKKLTSNFKQKEDGHLVIFSHSFGTYLLISAIEKCLANMHGWRHITLVLSGSVLHSDHDFTNILSDQRIRIINDCGIDDLAVCAGSSFILNSGMAGRIGFFGMNSNRLVNRFYSGGHSHYFSTNDFMKENWLPIIMSDPKATVKGIDERRYSFFRNSVFEKLISLLASIKPWTYIVVGLYLAYNSYASMFMPD